MAPRKDATAPTPSASQTQQDASSEGIEDFELPKLLITQLAKDTLPKDAYLEDDTITALVKGSTIFINHLTTTAQDIAASRAHKTISGADVLKALEVLQFGNVVSRFQSELEIFRQGNKVEKGKSRSVADTKGKGKDKPSPSSPMKSTTAQSIDVIQSGPVQHPAELGVTKNVNGDSTPDNYPETREAGGGEPPHEMDKPDIISIE